MPLRALLIGLAGLAIGALIGLMMYGMGPASPARIVASPPSSGVAHIGGPFELVDHTGAQRTDKDYRGRHMLVFFGFLYCPDICPATLQVIAETLDRLGDKRKHLAPLFITVDPARDTPAALSTYLANFDKQIVGLTGSKEQVDKATKAYRAYYKKVSEPALPDSYTVDHTTIIYLMGPDGRYVTHFTHGTSPADMAKRLRELL